jgi:hypothetical protein
MRGYFLQRLFFAVGFHVFPRKLFVKIEVNDYGLMDVGAVSFCMSAGRVTRRREGKSELCMEKHALHTFPLVLFGIPCILTNEGRLKYQEHVT